MPPVAAPSASPLLTGQTTLTSTLTGGIGIQRPIRPGPVPGKKPRSSDTLLNRRLAGGPNEQHVVQEFAAFRLGTSQDGEPGDQEITNRVVSDLLEDGVNSDDEEGIGDYIAARRYAYTREHKLAAIDYFQKTWKKLDNGDFERISVRYAARKLKITRKMLRSWVSNKASILNQRVGSKRTRKPWSEVKEQQMEIELYRAFEEARAQARKIDSKWFLRHARDIYGRLHPERVLRNENRTKTYLDFRFSPTWFHNFKRRYNISLRAGTKRAQKAPEELEPVIQAWLQFNRRMMVDRERDLAGGVNKTNLVSTGALNQSRPSAPLTCGRFKLSEISNMDQSPLPFESQKGRTYATKGSKTVTIRGAKSGWEKRQCTLQVIVFADGINRCKPLLMFKGKPISTDRRRAAEMKKYHPGVKVIFNDKAYANTENLIEWVKSQYSHASAFSFRENEPRFLALDAFAPHRNKGAKRGGKESEKERLKREKTERLQQELRDEFTKLNTTLSLIPGGCTGYVQVLDVSVNKIIKDYIDEYESIHIDENIEQWKKNGYSVSDRRILMTEWVGKAWERLHIEHKDTIINTFQNVGLSLNPDGSEDHKLKIKDLPNITVGDWHRQVEGVPIVDLINEGEGDTIIVDDGFTYITSKEASEGIIQGIENPNDNTLDSGDDSDHRFDYSSSDESGFDDQVDGDEDQDDENMEYRSVLAG